MLKVLVANENVKHNSTFCQFLKNNTEFDVRSTTSGTSTITEYPKLEPNILIIGSNFDDINYLDVLKHISSFPFENNKKNILLTMNQDMEDLKVKHTQKVYDIIYPPFEYSELLETINIMKKELKILELTNEIIEPYLIPLNIYMNSNGSHYLKSAIFYYHHYQNQFSNFVQIYELIANDNKVTVKEVQDGIRGALKPLNRYRDLITPTRLLKQFDPYRNISAQYFIETFVAFIRNEKNKS